jgi:tetratricopeptide (TPR) repeat protein
MNFDEQAQEIREHLASADSPAALRQAADSAVAIAGPWAEQSELFGAAKLLDEVIAAAEQADNPELAAKVLQYKVTLLTQFDLPQEALEDLERAIALVATEALAPVRKEFQVRKSLLLASLGRLPESLNLLHSIIENTDQKKAPGEYLRLLSILGSIHLRAAQNAQAEGVFKQAIEFARSGFSQADLTRLQLGLSQALVGQEKYEDAQTILLEQLLVASTSEVAVDNWDILAPAIEVSHQLQDWPTLSKLTHQAIELASRQGDYPAANMHRENLIGILLRQEQLVEAKAQLEVALDYARRKGPKERKLVHLMNLGRVCFDLGELEQSSQYYQSALETARVQQDQRSETTILGRLGALMAEQGDMEAALDYGEQAATSAEALADPLILAEQSVLLALTYRDVGKVEQALAASQQAADLYQQQGEREFAERALALNQQLANGE